MNKGKLAQILLLIIILLCLANLIKFKLITFSSITKDKDFIEATKDCVEIIAVVVGAIFSYFKFFAGRTFSTKGDVEVSCALIAAPNEAVLHLVTLTLVNKGTLTIWEPRVKLRITEFNSLGETVHLEDVPISTAYFNNKGNLIVMVDIGEKEDFVFQKIFLKDIWAVKYEAEIVAEHGRSWGKTFIVSNKAR